MIFITVGSQKFQFDRLLKEIDRIVESKEINDTFYAQIGYSDYKPKNYEYSDFMSQEEFAEKLNESDIIITHGGTGVIVNAVKKGKKVIAIPRLSKYGEHVDDHQIQIVKEFEQLKFIKSIYNVNELLSALQTIKTNTFEKYVSNTNVIIESIKEFVEGKNE